MDKELDELWKLILQHSSKTNTGQKKKGRLAGRNGTGEGNGKLQIRRSRTAAKYVKRIAANNEALQHKGWRLEGQTTTTVTKDRLSKQVWDPRGHKHEVHDQEIMVNLNFWSLMQEHLDPASNVMEWSHVVAKFIDCLDEFDFTEEDKLLK